MAHIGSVRLPSVTERTNISSRLQASRENRSGVARLRIFWSTTVSSLPIASRTKRLPVAHTTDFDEGGEIAAKVTYPRLRGGPGHVRRFVERALTAGFPKWSWRVITGSWSATRRPPLAASAALMSAVEGLHAGFDMRPARKPWSGIASFERFTAWPRGRRCVRSARYLLSGDPGRRRAVRSRRPLTAGVCARLLSASLPGRPTSPRRYCQYPSGFDRRKRPSPSRSMSWPERLSSRFSLSRELSWSRSKTAEGRRFHQRHPHAQCRHRRTGVPCDTHGDGAGQLRRLLVRCSRRANCW